MTTGATGIKLTIAVTGPEKPMQKEIDDAVQKPSVTPCIFANES